MDLELLHTMRARNVLVRDEDDSPVHAGFVIRQQFVLPQQILVEEKLVESEQRFDGHDKPVGGNQNQTRRRRRERVTQGKSMTCG